MKTVQNCNSRNLLSVYGLWHHLSQRSSLWCLIAIWRGGLVMNVSPAIFSQINLPRVIFIFFLSKRFSYFCCASCNEILNLSVRMLNILWWESYTIKLICKGWHFYSFSDKFYHWSSVYIQTRARVSILVWPRALWLSTQTWLLVLVWYNKGWIGSVGRIQQKYYIEISGGQFIPEAVVLFFSGLALVCYQLNSHN